MNIILTYGTTGTAQVEMEGGEGGGLKVVERLSLTLLPPSVEETLNYALPKRRSGPTKLQTVEGKPQVIFKPGRQTTGLQK